MQKIRYEEVFDRVRSCTELATFSSSLTQILAITRDPSADVRDLGTIISKDPALAAKILKTVNSCFYSFDRQIETIEDAVVLLGFGEIERLSLAITVINKFTVRRKQALVLNQLWLHCLVCGIAGETLAEVYRIRACEASDVYTAALLHDIGKAVILQAIPEAVPVIETVMGEQALAPFDAEQLVLDGANHALIGAWAAEQWGLPLSIVQCVQMHHSPLEAKGDSTLIKLIHMADLMCYSVGVPAYKLDNAPNPPQPPAAKFFQGNETLIARFRENYETKRASLEALTH